MRFSSIRHVLALAGIASIYALSTGCVSKVEVGQDNADGTQAITGTKGNTPVAAEAIALLYSQFPPPSPGGNTSSGGGGDGPDPDTLFVMVANYPISCAEPHASSGCDTWDVSIGIPPKLQVPGVLSLTDPALIAYRSQIDKADPATNECNSGGGGSFLEGTIEILSIDAKEVVFEIADTDDLFDFNADGVYTAARCP